MHVIATAGHVDHGKSTLVRALSGMEPDRWAEERRRGMTIDLGYAWTTLASGREVAFVDVPGHQRFVSNMLAGLVEPSAVLFVVAADEGWRRQSVEHLAAIDALGIEDGLLVVTRSDLADPRPALQEARDEIARTSVRLHGALAVSGVTGDGLDALRTALDGLTSALPARPATGRVRLWLDRAFTVRGVGTVVTGTLGSGRIAVGDELELRGARVAVRSIESLGRSRDSVEGPARVALNLRGVARDEVARGDVLLTPRRWPTTSVVDLRLVTPNERELPAQLMLHIGTAAVPVRLRSLGGDVARLTLSRPLPLVIGDRAVLRDPGEQQVVSGVLVLDADPPPLDRRGAAARRARELASATGQADADGELARRGYMLRDHLAALGTSAETLRDAVVVGDVVISPVCWTRWREQLVATVEERRRTHPLDPGLPLAAAARATGIPSLSVVVAAATAAGLESRGGRVSLCGEAPPIDDAIPGLRELTQRLREHPFAAPERPELAALGLQRRELAAAARAGRILLLEGDVVLLPDAPERARAELAALPQPFKASQARQALDTTRRVALPVLEHLDAIGTTRRLDGNYRVVQ